MTDCWHYVKKLKVPNKRGLGQGKTMRTKNDSELLVENLGHFDGDKVQ